MVKEIVFCIAFYDELDRPLLFHMLGRPDERDDDPENRIQGNHKKNFQRFRNNISPVVASIDQRVSASQTRFETAIISLLPKEKEFILGNPIPFDPWIIEII